MLFADVTKPTLLSYADDVLLYRNIDTFITQTQLTNTALIFNAPITDASSTHDEFLNAYNILEPEKDVELKRIL